MLEVFDRALKEDVDFGRCKDVIKRPWTMLEDVIYILLYRLDH